MFIFVKVSAIEQTLPVAGPCWIAGKVRAIASLFRDCSSQYLLGGNINYVYGEGFVVFSYVVAYKSSISGKGA